MSVFKSYKELETQENQNSLSVFNESEIVYEFTQDFVNIEESHEQEKIDVFDTLNPNWPDTIWPNLCDATPQSPILLAIVKTTKKRCYKVFYHDGLGFRVGNIIYRSFMKNEHHCTVACCMYKERILKLSVFMYTR